MNLRQIIQFKSGKRTLLAFLNREISVFFVFLIISFTLWYLNSLRKNMEYEIPFRITIKNLNTPAGFKEPLNRKAYLKLAGTGFSLVKASLNSVFSPLVIDAGELKAGNKISSATQEYYILAADLKPEFEKFIKPDLHLISLKPDTIFLEKVPKD